ncbi:unnamed protein product [Closterium sp. NIES-54]
MSRRVFPPVALPAAAGLVALLLVAAAAGGVRGGVSAGNAALPRKLAAGGSGNSAAAAELVKDSPRASAEGDGLVVKDSAPSASGGEAEAEAQIPPLQLILAEEGRAEGAGGAWCASPHACVWRARMHLGSTAHARSAAEMVERENGSMNGMLSSNRTVNPGSAPHCTTTAATAGFKVQHGSTASSLIRLFTLCAHLPPFTCCADTASHPPLSPPGFYNWNAVYFIYCDGGSFSGDQDEPIRFNVSHHSPVPPPLRLSASPLPLSPSPPIQVSASPPLCLSASPPFRLLASRPFYVPVSASPPLRFSSCCFFLRVLPLPISPTSQGIPLYLQKYFDSITEFNPPVFVHLPFPPGERGEDGEREERVRGGRGREEGAREERLRGGQVADVLVKVLMEKMGLGQADRALFTGNHFFPLSSLLVLSEPLFPPFPSPLIFAILFRSSSGQVVVAGCSAGGVAALLHCDRVKDTLTAASPSMRVRCLADASMFLDM